MTSRPTEELMQSTYASKRVAHLENRALPLPEKVRQVIELQRIDYEMRRQRGERPQWWQHPWESIDD
jgi:hypothetical protein